MQLETQKSLNDIRNACEKVSRFTNGLSFESYEDDDLVQSGVERNFEITGFRNLLAHGYDIVDNDRVWFVITVALPRLRTEVDHLLEPT